jgi:hypothetical protein
MAEDEWKDIEVTVQVTCAYKVEDGVVTVKSIYGSKSTLVGGSPPEFLARRMLRELVSEAKSDRSWL